MTTTPRFATLLLIGLCLDCGGEGVRRSEVLVYVDADQSVRSDMDVLQIEAFVGRADDWEQRLDWPQDVKEGFIWPVAFTVVAREGDLESLVEVRASAQSTGRALTHSRAISTFEESQTVRVELQLEESCRRLGSLCEELNCHGPECQTCRGGACVPTGIEQGLLKVEGAEGRLVE